MRVLVVGVGHIAVGQYLPWLASQPDVELACMTRSEHAAERAREDFGARNLGDWEDARSFQPDVAFNLTADRAHSDVLRRLVSFGVARIYTEKPLVARDGQERIGEHDLAEALHIAKDAEQAGTEIAVGYNYRFFPNVLHAKVDIEGGALGDLTSIVADTHHACLTHVVDLVNVFGGPVARLSAHETFSGADLPATRAVAFLTASGVAGTLAVSSRRAFADRLFTMSMSGTNGSARVADLGAEYELVRPAAGIRAAISPSSDHSRWRTYDDSFAAALEEYLGNVRKGVTASTGISAALAAIQFEAAVHRSIGERRAVELAPGYGLR